MSAHSFQVLYAEMSSNAAAQRRPAKRCFHCKRVFYAESMHEYTPGALFVCLNKSSSFNKLTNVNGWIRKILWLTYIRTTRQIWFQKILRKQSEAINDPQYQYKYAFLRDNRTSHSLEPHLSQNVIFRNEWDINKDENTVYYTYLSFVFAWFEFEDSWSV